MPRLETFTTEAFRRVATAASGVMTTEVPISILGSDRRSAMLLVLLMFNESTFASQTAASYSKWLPGPAPQLCRDQACLFFEQRRLVFQDPVLVFLHHCHPVQLARLLERLFGLLSQRPSGP
jgi:hypothetical protein